MPLPNATPTERHAGLNSPTTYQWLLLVLGSATAGTGFLQAAPLAATGKLSGGFWHIAAVLLSNAPLFEGLAALTFGLLFFGLGWIAWNSALSLASIFLTDPFRAFDLCIVLFAVSAMLCIFVGFIKNLNHPQEIPKEPVFLTGCGMLLFCGTSVSGMTLGNMRTTRKVRRQETALSTKLVAAETKVDNYRHIIVQLHQLVQSIPYHPSIPPELFP
jgi:hypothetical protein